MRFLVQMELIDTEARAQTCPRTAPEQAGMPAVNACARLEREGRIVAGGLCAGARTLTFIAEARSSDELAALLEDMPESGRMRIGVTVLDPFGARAGGRGCQARRNRVRRATSGGAKAPKGASTFPAPRLSSSGSPLGSKRPKG